MTTASTPPSIRPRSLVGETQASASTSRRDPRLIPTSGVSAKADRQAVTTSSLTSTRTTLNACLTPTNSPLPPRDLEQSPSYRAPLTAPSDKPARTRAGRSRPRRRTGPHRTHRAAPHRTGCRPRPRGAATRPCTTSTPSRATTASKQSNMQNRPPARSPDTGTSVAAPPARRGVLARGEDQAGAVARPCRIGTEPHLRVPGQTARENSTSPPPGTDCAGS